MSGDLRGLSEASVCAVDPNDKFHLVLSNGDGLTMCLVTSVV